MKLSLRKVYKNRKIDLNKEEIFNKDEEFDTFKKFGNLEIVKFYWKILR